MSDLIFIATVIGFFALSIAYTNACQMLEGAPMTDTFWLGGVALVVFVYLFYALLAPEKF